MLTLKNIKKSFSQIADPILKNINLTIEKDEYCIILGSNGSGKSTLLKIISGEYKADSGQILLDGLNVTKQSIHLRAKHISSVAQDITNNTIQDMTLLDNMSLSQIRGKNAKYKFYKSKTKEISNKIKLLGLGLEKFLHSNISTLSGGQRQSIATLMALSPEPSVLLLDEHTSALDPRSREKIMRFTDRYIRLRKITTLMITHNIEDAVRYGTRLIIMHHGEIVYDLIKREQTNLSSEKILNILQEVGGSQ